MSVSLDDIGARITEGVPLTSEDAQVLSSVYDIVSLGMMADEILSAPARAADDVSARRVCAGGCVRRRGHGLALPAASEIRLSGTVPRAGSGAGARDEPRRSNGNGRVRCLAGRHRTSCGWRPDGGGAWLRTLGSAGLASVSEAPVDLFSDVITMVRAAQNAGVPIARVTVDDHGPDGVLGTIERLEPLVAADLRSRPSRHWPEGQRPNRQPVTPT